MTSFEERLALFPPELRKAWSVGFVFMYNGKTFHHFPARQWTDTQIKAYFQENYDSPSVITEHPDLQLKELQVEKYPEWVVVIPY